MRQHRKSVERVRKGVVCGICNVCRARNKCSTVQTNNDKALITILDAPLNDQKVLFVQGREESKLRFVQHTFLERFLDEVPRIRQAGVAELYAENVDVTVIPPIWQVWADKLVDHIGGLA